jgi:hypothetical protein
VLVLSRRVGERVVIGKDDPAAATDLAAGAVGPVSQD